MVLACRGRDLARLLRCSCSIPTVLASKAVAPEAAVGTPRNFAENVTDSN